MSSPDLLFFTVAIYGLSWLLTKSRLLAPVRDYAGRRSQIVGYLLSCIVCSSVWVCLLVLACSPVIQILRIRPTIPDVPMLLGWTMGATWILARLLGDAD